MKGYPCQRSCDWLLSRFQSPKLAVLEIVYLTPWNLSCFYQNALRFIKNKKVGLVVNISNLLVPKWQIILHLERRGHRQSCEMSPARALASCCQWDWVIITHTTFQSSWLCSTWDFWIKWNSIVALRVCFLYTWTESPDTFLTHVTYPNKENASRYQALCRDGNYITTTTTNI